MLFIYSNAQFTKLQYVGKSKTPFHIRSNNHNKDINNPGAIPACKHLNSSNHDFNTYRKFKIIE